MKIKNLFKKPLIPLVLAALLHHVEITSADPVLVDSFLSGNNWHSTSPFAGLTGATPSWQDLGGIFIPNLTSQLTEFDVSIFAEANAQGAARLTIFQYDQPLSYSTYVSIGPTLGYAEVPVSSSGGLGGLVAFNFSSQSIQLQAGQTYAYMLSDPQSTTLIPAWRRVGYALPGGLEINSEDQFTGGGFDYATVDAEETAHYEVFATPVPEPSPLTSVVVMLGGMALVRVWHHRRGQADIKRVKKSMSG